MCSQKTIDGIDSGKLIAVPYWLGLFRYFNPIAMVGFIFYLGVTKTQVEEKIEQNAQHSDDHAIHATYKEHVEYFVPRTEVEYKLNAIDEKLDELIEFKNKRK